MTISLIQAILIGLWSGFCLAGSIWGIYTNRSLILAFGVGLVLGDMPTALAMGAVSEIAFMGFGVGAGGTVPPNQLGPGIVGTLMAITLKSSGITVESALALSIPFAIAVQFLITATYTALSPVNNMAKKAIENGKYKKFALLGQSTIIAFLFAGFIIGFGAAFNMEATKWIISLIPQWLIKGLSVAGGMLPAIGFAMILNIMVKKEYSAFVVLGILCVAYGNMPVIGIALAALVVALYDYYNNTGKSKENEEEAVSNGI